MVDDLADVSNAVNGQPWHFTAITNAEPVQKIADGMRFSSGPSSTPEGDKAPDVHIYNELIAVM